jgi:hypothetical protein
MKFITPANTNPIDQLDAAIANAIRNATAVPVGDYPITLDKLLFQLSRQG